MERYRLARETLDDAWEVEALLDTAFAPGRGALSSYRLRAGPPLAALCHVARDAGGILAGAIRFWPVRVGATPTLLLGPVAVHPTRQGEGLGALLIEESLGRAEGWDPGSCWSGTRRTTDASASRPWTASLMPPPTDPARVLGRALRPGAWEGVVGPVTADPPAARRVGREDEEAK